MSGLFSCAKNKNVIHKPRTVFSSLEYRLKPHVAGLHAQFFPIQTSQEMNNVFDSRDQSKDAT